MDCSYRADLIYIIFLLAVRDIRWFSCVLLNGVLVFEPADELHSLIVYRLILFLLLFYVHNVIVHDHWLSKLEWTKTVILSLQPRSNEAYSVRK